MKTFFMLVVGLTIQCHASPFVQASIIVPQTVQEYLTKTTRAEDGALDPRDPYFAEFQVFFKEHWVEMLDNIENITTSNREKIVIIATGERLDDKDYLAFLHKIQLLFLDGKIDEGVLMTVFTPSGVKEGFLVNHANYPLVQTFFKSIRPHLQSTGQVKLAVDSIIEYTSPATNSSSASTPLTSRQSSMDTNMHTPPIAVSTASGNSSPFIASSADAPANDNKLYLIIVLGVLMVVVVMSIFIYARRRNGEQ